MSIVRLTDSEVRERTMRPIDDKQDLWDLAVVVTERSLCSVGLTDIEGGVRVLAINYSGQSIIDENCPLPQDDDDEFTKSRKRTRIRMVKDRMRKLIRDEPRPAA